MMTLDPEIRFARACSAAYLTSSCPHSQETTKCSSSPVDDFAKPSLKNPSKRLRSARSSLLSLSGHFQKEIKHVDFLRMRLSRRRLLLAACWSSRTGSLWWSSGGETFAKSSWRQRPRRSKAANPMIARGMRAFCHHSVTDRVGYVLAIARATMASHRQHRRCAQWSRAREIKLQHGNRRCKDQQRTHNIFWAYR